MAKGNVTRAVGTAIKKGEDTIGNLTSIGGIEITADSMDITTLDSDGGEVPLEGFFVADDTGQMALQQSIDGGQAEEYEITFPTTPATSWKFSGVVTSFKVGDVELDGAVNFGATIKVSGKPTLTTGGGA